MNFYQHQDQARGRTAWLLVLLTSALVAIVGLFEVGLWIAFEGRHQEPAYWISSVGIAVFFVLVIGGGSLVRTVQLSFGGGKSVAESLGGTLLHPGNDLDPAQRRLLNIVEEIALAAGISVPPVYLLEEPGINAFAAGFSPSDAVIGITRGCVETLNRDELQGVIAHEFSHILNGDMRLNIRLMGLIFGLVVLSLLGEILVRLLGNVHVSSNSKSKNNAAGIVMALFMFGIGLWILGFVGTFFARVIQAAISRQREFLADASAVQFTRNPEGIAGALKKIGGFTDHGVIRSPEATEVNHMFFACGLKRSGFLSLDSHPPLEERIRRIEPNWDGEFLQATNVENQEMAQGGEAIHKGLVSGLAGEGVTSGLAGTFGALEPPPFQKPIRENGALESALDAVSLAESLAGANQDSAAAVSSLARASIHWTTLEKAKRMALLAPWIRQLSPSQKTAVLNRLELSPPPTDLFSACFRQVLSLWLLNPRQKMLLGQGASRSHAALNILASVARAGGMSGVALQTGWQKAVKHLAKAMPAVPIPPDSSPVPDRKYLSVLAVAPEGLRRRFLDACGVLIRQDQVWTESERVIIICLSAALDIPTPPDALAA